MAKNKTKKQWQSKIKKCPHTSFFRVLHTYYIMSYINSISYYVSTYLHLFPIGIVSILTQCYRGKGEKHKTESYTRHFTCLFVSATVDVLILRAQWCLF